jgi:hypothetical protein
MMRCANCNKRFAAPTHSGRYQHTSERRIKSARYCSPACRQATYVTRRAARTGIPHSERHKAFRGRVTDVENRVTGAGDTDLATSVTHALQPTEISNEIRSILRVGRGQLGAVSIEPDGRWPNMYRLRYPDGSLSDMVNLTRAKDALRSWEERR